MKRILPAIPLIILASFMQACFGVEYGETIKSTPTSQSFVGEWRSASATGFPTPQSCSDLKWTVTSQSATQISGNFEATCAGGVKLTGTANAVLNVNLNIDASGTATGFGSAPCLFTLTGTGVLQSDSSILVTYTGQTCIGPISGSEVLRR